MGPSKGRAFLSLILCSLVSLTACGESGSALHASTPAPTPFVVPTRTPLTAPIPASAVIPPPGKIYFGAYPATSGIPQGDTPAATAALEQELGRSLALHLQFKDFGADLASPTELDDFDHFRMSVVSLYCIDANSQVASGKYDSTITLMAQDAAQLAWPIFVRYMFDPNLPAGIVQSSTCWSGRTDDPNQVFSPTAYIAAWDHIRSIFASVGAVNVSWVWSVSASSLASNPLPYYPGASEVDWVGIDDYDTGNTGFTATFSTMYAELATLGKPMMITETGALPGEQPDFFTEGAQSLQANFPLIRAFIYFDSISYVTGQNEDWRVTPGNFPGFMNFANDPYLSAVYGE